MFDGVAVVQMLPPKVSKSFQGYADNVFLPYILRQLETISRTDVVWDVCLPDNLKAAMRGKNGRGVGGRGSGPRRRVSTASLIPGNWRGFLRVNVRSFVGSLVL